MFMYLRVDHWLPAMWRSRRGQVQTALPIRERTHHPRAPADFLHDALQRSPHVLRHICAMHTLQATHDVRKVSLWLGHATLQSTEVYLRADPTGKLEALAAMEPPPLRPGRFKEPDKLLAMLSDVQSAQKYAERGRR